jgi:tetratricopeptide (TPR) repeat protein
MFRTHWLSIRTVCILFAASSWAIAAENEGQADLDRATQVKVTAETLDDLGEVIDRIDSALEKGLDKENTKFAKKMLISALLQRGQQYAGAVFTVSEQDPQRGLHAMQFRQYALTDLQRVVSLDGKLIDAQMSIGKLQSLPLGDPAAARRAFSKVVAAAEAKPERKAEAYALRSALQKDSKDQLADLNKAVELQPKKSEYLRLRGQYYAGQEKFAEALADVDQALKMDPKHADTHQLRGMIQLGLKKYDDALASFDKASKLMPDSPLPFQQRGEVYRQKGELQKSLEQLTKALELSPESVGTLLVRAGVYFELKQPDRALEDIDAAIKLQPARPEPHLMRAEVLAASNRLEQAISELEHLLQSSPNNLQLLNQLGSFYVIAGRPRKAIESVSQILAKRPDNYAALRIRSDAYLNIGKHAEAIADFERAYSLKADDESLLNNFAWVLATSPDEKLRDGPRALKLATKAAEACHYQTPHVLSTLAAAYAETGDFENAAKWSQKSVELAEKAVGTAKADEDRKKLKSDRDQLKKELDSYHKHKPVRERQTAEEAGEKVAPADHASSPTASAPARTADF